MYFGGGASSRQRSDSRNSNNNNNNNPNTRGSVKSGSFQQSMSVGGVGGVGGFSRAASLYIKSATLERELTGERVRAETAMQSTSQNRYNATVQTFLMAEVENRFRKVIIPERDARVEIALHMVHSAQWATASSIAAPTIQEKRPPQPPLLIAVDSASAAVSVVAPLVVTKTTANPEEATQEELDAFEQMRAAQERQRMLTTKLESENIKLRRELQEARMMMQNQQREYDDQINMYQQQIDEQVQLQIAGRRNSPDQQQQQQQVSAAGGGFSSPMSPSYQGGVAPTTTTSTGNMNMSNNHNNNDEDMQDIRNQLETLRHVAAREEGQLAALRGRLAELTKLYHGALQARDAAVQQKEEMRSALHEMETSCALEIQRVRRAAAGEVMTLQRALTAVDRDRTVSALHVGESIAQITQNTKRREQNHQLNFQVQPTRVSLATFPQRSNPMTPSISSSTSTAPIGLNTSSSIHNQRQHQQQQQQSFLPRTSLEQGRAELRNLYDRFVTDGSNSDNIETPKGWR